MKKLLLLILVVGFYSHAEDSATHKDSPALPQDRPEVKQVKDRSADLFKYISACLPGPQGQASGNQDLPADLPSTDSATQVSGTDGASLFQSKCLSCHASNGKPLAGKSGSELSNKLTSGAMPPKGSQQANGMTDADKAALQAFLQTK